MKFEFDIVDIWRKMVSLASSFRVEHFLLLYFAVHMLQIAFPTGGSMIFDEAHYVPASTLTLQGLPANLEHPPFGKIIGAIGIALLGNNWFGWRFPQVVIQIAGLYLFYLVAKRLLGDPWALGATMLLGLDTLFFIHGGALLLDMPEFTLGFLTIELYFRKHYGWAAVAMALTFFEREFGIFIFITIITYHIVANRRALKPAAKVMARFALLAIIITGALFWMYDISYQPAQAISVTNNVNANIVLNATGNPITTIFSTSASTSKDLMWNPVQNILYEYTYHGPHGIVLNDENTSRAYEHPLLWILPVDPLDSAYYFLVNVTVTTGNVVTHYAPIWYRAQGNLPLWYGIWPAAIGLAIAFLRRKESETAFFIAMGIASNYLPSVILDELTRRIGFNYYMLYVLPFNALGLAFTIKMIPGMTAKLVLGLYLFTELVFFIWFFPVRPMP